MKRFFKQIEYPKIMTHLKPGDKAPSFSGLNENGEKVLLNDLKGKKLILFFIQKTIRQLVLLKHVTCGTIIRCFKKKDLSC